MPTAKPSAISNKKGRRNESIGPDRLESLKHQYQSLVTFEAIDRFLSQLTLDELRAMMNTTRTKPTRHKTQERQALLRRHIIRSEYQSLKTDRARDKFLDRLSSSELHALMISTLDVDLLKERLGL